MTLSRGLARVLFFAAAAAAVGLARPVIGAPTPTPTPRPRLSGGFGRTPVPQATAVPGDGQSMADVVRAAGAGKEKEKKDQRGVAITNENLVKDPNKGRLTTSQAKPAPTPARPAAAPAPGGTAPPPSLVPGAPTDTTPGGAQQASAAAANAAAADEAAWRDRARRARQRVEDLKSQVAALDTETKRLENDFYRWDDGQYRDRVIKPQWDKSREELETAKRQLTAAEADLADLPEQARKAGALPGWLRE